MLAVLALVGAGCSLEDAQQESAREEVQKHVRGLGPDGGRYDADDVHCTDAAKTFFREEETNEFVCAVRVVDGGCDWFAVGVHREERRVDVALAQRDAGCTLGP
ncbi:MAG TPA: hypothetical protein VLS46_02605 [Gaiellaceae bacterium]|nr:hypothetical protein [Gaiellaceae bacterium]